MGNIDLSVTGSGASYETLYLLFLLPETMPDDLPA
jgi:hypothetical protein